ncbi:MAG: carboxypeptidase M32 [Myxococcota bacterium]
MTHDNYEALLEKLRRVRTLEYVIDALHWDQETMMPPRGSAARAEAVAMLEELHHGQCVDPRLGELLDAAGDGGDDPVQTANIREARRTVDRARKIPASLVVELARVTTLGHPIWVEARKNESFAEFVPTLKTIVDLKRQEAECIGFETTPYDPLLDVYEPAMTTAELSALFDELRPPLVELAEKIAASERKLPTLGGPFPIDDQFKLSRSIARKLGYEFEAGRLDMAVHPFTSGEVPGDIRITTRARPEALEECIYSVIHEVGHALYEQGADPDQMLTPAGRAVSLGVHESQSRLWENQIGRSRAFATWLLPQLRDTFSTLAVDDADALYLALNSVAPGHIRTEADEITYNLHIIMRFEIERALLEKNIEVDDLEEAWNERAREYLNLTPPNARLGVLQDIHWVGGHIGYFPTYTLGNIYAAELFAAAQSELTDLDDAIAVGEFAPLLGWLRENIHRQGRLHPAKKLVERATGHAPTATPLIGYLQKKFGDVYSLD